MQVKHTFLFVFVLSLVWCGVLFANLLSPDLGQNNIYSSNPMANPTQSCTCHGSSPLTTLITSGLDTEWVPNKEYHITVAVPNDPPGTTYGFQLSAVFSGTRNQAGTITIDGVDPNAMTVKGPAGTSVEGVTFAVSQGSGSGNNRHAPTQSVYKVKWVAPSTGGA